MAGDVTDAASVRRAMTGVTSVFHVAGRPEQWTRDPTLFTRVNVDGTRHLVEAALAEGVASFVYTSTINVFEFAPGRPFEESQLATAAKSSAYDRSKQLADHLVTAAVARGLPARLLHPAGVYGPAPTLTPGVNDVLVRLARGQVPLLLPGGMPLVHSADVAAGHLLAEDAPVGSRYILSESYLSLAELAALVAGWAGRSRVPTVLPRPLARLVATGGTALARLTGRAPLVSRDELAFLTGHALPSAERARRELGWSPRPAAVGVPQTLDTLTGPRLREPRTRP